MAIGKPTVMGINKIQFPSWCGGGSDENYRVDRNGMVKIDGRHGLLDSLGFGD